MTTTIDSPSLLALNAYLAGLAPRTADANRQAFGHLADAVAAQRGPRLAQWGDRLEGRHLAAALRRLHRRGWPTGSMGRAVATARGVLLEMGRRDALCSSRLVDCLEVLRGTSSLGAAHTPTGSGYVLDPADITRLFDDAVVIPRARGGERLVASLSYDCGLAAADIMRLQHDDLDVAAGTLAIARAGRIQVLRLPPRTLGYIPEWLNFRGAKPGPLLGVPGVGRGGPIRALRDDELTDRVGALARSAGVDKCSLHALRRTGRLAAVELRVV